MTRLIERDALLARLVAARRDGGLLLLVGGEASVGKTALVRAFTAELDGRVLLGACEHLGTPAPLGPSTRGAPDLPADEIVEVADTVIVRPDPAPVAA